MKIMKKIILNIVSLSMLLFIATSCDNSESDAPKGAYDNGVLVSGEGGATGSVYYVSNDFKTVESSIYKAVNNKDLGTYLQSMAFSKSNAFLVVDNQNTITVVDRYTFKQLGAITTGLKIPRYMTVVGSKGYVTNWGEGTWGADVADDYVAIVDLNTFTVTGTIPVGSGPERIIEKNGKLYVSHKGGFSYNNIVTVIDIDSKATTEIVVNETPDELLFDTSGNLVVLCEGRKVYNPDWSVKEHTIGAIVKINTSTNKVSSQLNFAAGVHPNLLDIDGSDLFYNIGNKIYKVGQSSTSLPSAEFLQTSAGSNYGMAINGGNLFVADAGNFTSQGDLLVYDLTSKTLLQSVKAPIAASKIYFN